jgi:hypothetical protein
VPCHWRKIGAGLRTRTDAVLEGWARAERRAAVFWKERRRACDQIPRKWRRVTILEVLRKVWLGRKLVNVAGGEK